MLSHKISNLKNFLIKETSSLNKSTLKYSNKKPIMKTPSTSLERKMIQSGQN